MRIATFNLENLDLNEQFSSRSAELRPQLQRINADILCLQEVHSQEVDAGRNLLALKELITDTQYEKYELVSTLTDEKEPFAQRNLVILTKFRVVASGQIKHTIISPPAYGISVTSEPPELLTWERPIQWVRIDVPDIGEVTVINLHMKSKNPTTISGQKVDSFTWKSASAWAEGSFISTIRRVGQSLEVRSFVDQLFDKGQDKIVVLGDFNSDQGEPAVVSICGHVSEHNNPALGQRELVVAEKTIPESNRFSLYHRGQKNMIDHILLSKALLPFYKHTEIHNEMLQDESIAFATDNKFPGSDHAPVVVELG